MSYIITPILMPPTRWLALEHKRDKPVYQSWPSLRVHRYREMRIYDFRATTICPKASNNHDNYSSKIESWMHKGKTYLEQFVRRHHHLKMPHLPSRARRSFCTWSQYAIVGHTCRTNGIASTYMSYQWSLFHQLVIDLVENCIDQVWLQKLWQFPTWFLLQFYRFWIYFGSILAENPTPRSSDTNCYRSSLQDPRNSEFWAQFRLSTKQLIQTSSNPQPIYLPIVASQSHPQRKIYWGLFVATKTRRKLMKDTQKETKT